MAIRKKFRRIDDPDAARFITFSCYRRLKLFNNDRIKDRFVEHLSMKSASQSMSVLAWVVMPEHVHLVLLPDSLGQITPFLTSLKSGFAREMCKRLRDLDAEILKKLDDGRGGFHFWQLGGGYDRCMDDELFEKIRYCHQNPITRGLSLTSEQWKWSSARAYEGRSDYAGPSVDFDALPRSSLELT